jgi:nucleotide-binding universal stress UspA family protein
VVWENATVTKERKMLEETAVAAAQDAPAVLDPLLPPGARYLVGFDGSSASRIALGWAAARAREVDRPVVLVGVVDDSAGTRSADWIEQSAHELAVLLSSRAEALQQADDGLAVETLLAAGDVAPALVRAVEEGDAVVVGTDKTGWVQGRVYGSRSIQLAGVAEGVVVIVPVGDLRLRRGVVAAIEDVPGVDELVRVAAREALRQSAPLLLVHAVAAGAGDAGRQRGERLLDRARRVARSDSGTLEIASHLVQRHPAEALLNLSRDRALLVVRRSRHRGPLGVGRTLHDLLMNLNVPIVVLPGA